MNAELNMQMLNADEIDLLQAVSSELSRHNFELCNEQLDQVEEILYNMEFANNYYHLNVMNVFRLKSAKPTAYIVNLKPSYNRLSSRSSIEDFELIAFFETDKNIGHVLIRPETLADKIAEIFQKTEIDFESHPKFSSRYYMLSDNKTLTETTINRSLLSELEQAQDLHMELKDKNAMITFLNNMTVDGAENLAVLSKKINTFL